MLLPSEEEGAMPNGYEVMTEFSPETEQFEDEQFEFGGAEIFGEAQQMELAMELLEVRDEAELDRFLGSLISSAGRALGKVVRSPVGRAIGGILKGVAKKALPVVGGALGAYVGGPLGAKIGSGLASAAGKALGLELQELSAAEQELEGARRFVQLAGDTVKGALAAPPSVDPQLAARAAAAAGVRKFIPGLIPTAGATPASAITMAGRGRSGRWVRAGHNIIVVNV